MSIYQYELVSTDGSVQEVTSWYQSGQNTSIISALAGCQKAGQLEATVSEQVNMTPIGPTIGFPVLTAARLTYVTSNGNRCYLLIPGVDPTIFLSDGETVDPSNSAVAALSTAVITNGVSQAGDAITQFVGGCKVRLPAQPYTL